MEYMNEDSFIRLSLDSESFYTSITFDGEFYYLTVKQYCCIHKYDCWFNFIECYHTSHNFQSICYDHDQICFWANDGLSKKLYQLDTHMIVVDSFFIPYLEQDEAIICGLSICNIHNTLYLCMENKVIEIETTGKFIRIVTIAENEVFCNVTCFTAGYFLLIKGKDIQQLDIYSFHNKRLKSLNLPTFSCVFDLILNPDVDWIEEYIHLYLLVDTKCGMALNKWCIPLFAPDCMCEEEQTAYCDECIMKDIVASIALIEASLSHILNAEGEKLQKAITLATCVNELLTVNASVNKTIIRVTQLENILYEKLALVKDTKCICSKSK